MNIRSLSGIASLLTLMFASTLVAGEPPGTTVANEKVVAKIMGDLSVVAVARHKCTKVSVTNTKYLGKEKEVNLDSSGRTSPNAIWEEWFINQCGNEEKYQVILIPGGPTEGYFVALIPPK